MDKGEFVGREALERAKSAGVTRTLVALESIERGIPRDGYKVLDLQGNEIGCVTSGSYAPFLKKNIALAYVPTEFAPVATEVAVQVRNQPVKCKVVPIPFYKRPKKQS
jgi:aminomethyltransferase